MSRIALIGENSVEYIEHLLKIWNSGDCAVLIDCRTPFEKALEMMREACVKTCYVQKSVLHSYGGSLDNEIRFIGYEKLSNSAQILPTYIYKSFQGNYSHSEAVVLYSSGTTGKSKGIILSHYAINTNADAIIEYMGPSESDCMYIVKSLTHSSTLTGELLVCLKAKIKLIVAPVVIPPRYILNNISSFGVSIICVNPTLLSLLCNEKEKLDYNLSSLKVVYVSGSVLPDKLYLSAKKVLSGIPLYNVYGLSEAGPRVTAQNQINSKSNSVGVPISNVEVKIIDENGAELTIEEKGMIHVKTQSLFSGYTCGQEKQKSFYPGWFNTGDVGYFDNNNELHIVGRNDNLIIKDSHKIYPEDVEKIVLTVPEIDECYVCSIVDDDKTRICCLYTGAKLNEMELKKKLLSLLLPYEVPDLFVHSAELPKNSNQKVSIEMARKIINDNRRI